MPDVWVNKLKIVILSQAAGIFGMYFFIESFIFSLPRSSSSRIEAAVNCLVTDPMRNFVVGEFGIFHSRFASPYSLLVALVHFALLEQSP